MIDTVAAMAQGKIRELPVVDAEGRPVGLIDVTDVVTMFPELNDHGGERSSKPGYRVFPPRRTG